MSVCRGGCQPLHGHERGLRHQRRCYWLGRLHSLHGCGHLGIPSHPSCVNAWYCAKRPGRCCAAGGCHASVHSLWCWIAHPLRWCVDHPLYSGVLHPLWWMCCNNGPQVVDASEVVCLILCQRRRGWRGGIVLSFSSRSITTSTVQSASNTVGNIKCDGLRQQVPNIRYPCGTDTQNTLSRR